MKSFDEITVAEIKQILDEKGITYDGVTLKADLYALLPQEEGKYKVLVNFTLKGATRGYIKGEKYPRKGDATSEDIIKKLLGENEHGIKYIEE